METGTLEFEDISKTFQRDVSRHQMTVVLDQGIHRHLSFQRPDDSALSFEIITWPGCLAIHGDMGSYVFERTQDMFTFFGGPRIDPRYWAEKLKAHSRVAAYSPAAFRRRVTEWADSKFNDEIDDIEESMTGRSPAHAQLHAALEHELFYYTDGSDDEVRARERLEAFSHNGITFTDVWEMNFNDWDYHYLWCCHAVQWAIRSYWTAVDAREAAATSS